MVPFGIPSHRLRGRLPTMSEGLQGESGSLLSSETYRMNGSPLLQCPPCPAGAPPPDLAQTLASLSAIPVAEQLRRLVAKGLGELVLPAGGQTLQRWRSLSRVAQHSLSLAKLYEGHTDALAILEELAAGAPEPGTTWAMWAAEAPGQHVLATPTGCSGRAALRGTKAWCSGAQGVSHALLTARLSGHSNVQLVTVDLSHPSIHFDTSAWRAVGMADTLSAAVTFNDTPAALVGQPGDYVGRPGFWHGGAGIAACWYGGTLAVADALYHAMLGAARDHPGWPYRAAALGKVDHMLSALACLLRTGADWIDAHPQADAMMVALRLRQAAEATATAVLAEAGRALGAPPFCRDTVFGRAAADLPVFIRQSHGDRDDAALAGAILASEEYPWAL